MSTIFRTIRFLLFHQWGPFAIVAALIVGAVTLQPSFLTDLYDEVLELLGLGFVPIVVWLALFLAVLRLRPRWLWRFRRSWAGAALLVPAVVGAQAYSEGIDRIMGLNTPETLGGNVGQEILGTSDLLGALRLLGLLLLTAVVFRPRYSYRVTRVSLRQGGRILQVTGRKSYSGIRWLLKALGSSLATVRRRRSEAPPQAADIPDEAPVPAPEDDWPLAEEEVAATWDEGATPTAAEPPEKEPVIQEEVEAHQEPEREAVSSAVRAWRLPSLELFEVGPPARVTEEDNIEVARRIAESLGHHGVEVRVDQIKPGPTVTLYGLTPGWVRR